MKNLGWRFVMVTVLALAMMIPLTRVADIINDPRNLSNSVIASVGFKWGGKQLISGLQLVIPVAAKVIQQQRREVIDPKLVNSSVINGMISSINISRRP